MEFDEIVVKDSPGLCRCCLSEGCYKDLGSEYVWMSETEVYADMLLDCFDISISQHNEGPNGPNRLICEVCITRLRDACNFKKQVLDSEKKFVDMVGKGEFSKTVVTYQDPMKTELPVQRDITDVEYLDEDLDFEDDNFNEPTETEATVEEDITVSMLPIKTKRGRPKKSVVKPEKVKMPKLEEKPRTSKVAKDKYGMNTHVSANKLRRRNLQILFNYTSIIPFKYRGKCRCFYCGEELPVYNDLKNHTKAHGKCLESDRSIRLVKTDEAEVKVDVSDISCEICNELFETIKDIVAHLIVKHRMPYDTNVKLLIIPLRLIDFKCITCDNKYNSVSDLVVHVNTEHANQHFICDMCKHTFIRKRDLDAHIRKEHKSIYVCTKCDSRFETHAALQEHKSKNHIAMCNICFKCFTSPKNRLNHIKVKHADDVLRCGFCQKIMSTKLGFLRHASRCTKVAKTNTQLTVYEIEDKKPAVVQIRNNIACLLNMTTIIPFKYFMSRFRCFYCPKDFNDCQNLREHTVTEHPICDVNLKCMRLRNRQEGCVKLDTSILSCKMCYETMQDLNCLIDHLVLDHKAQYDKSIDSNIQPFKLIKDNYPCPMCEQVYTYFSTLLKHVGQVHTENKNICVHCGKSFRNLPNLRVHISNHHKTSGSFKCDRCDLEFSSNKYLQTHLGRVHDIKVVECIECREKFTSNYGMQRHMINAHSAGHKCPYCGKLFTGNSFMVDHVKRTHLKEKNVQCQVCSERFFDAQRLKTHMVKHNGERNFHCDFCGKKFLWKKNLRSHMALHLQYGHKVKAI